MKTLFTAVRCLECGHEVEDGLFATRCGACGSAWVEARYDTAALPIDWPELVAQRPADVWRYRELLPFPEGFRFVTMGEGWTPLTRAEGLERESGYGDTGGELWVKDERQQPTGSFKDRQAAFTISALKAEGIDEMVLASTGNAAAAYAAYCARADIKLWVFLPSSVPAEKMRELALYGAEVVKITGTYDQTKEVAADFAARRDIYRDQGAKAIPGRESMKTIAFEIAEQMGWQAPDWYVQAVSGGIGPLGVLKGFTELQEAGLIDRVPKLGIVQAEGCAPMVRAWGLGRAQAEEVTPDTLVTVLATGKPGLAYEILKRAGDRYGGAMVAVSDGDAFRAMRRVARSDGFSMEPAASVAFAGLERLLDEGHIQPGERVVVNCSGHTFSAEKHALEDRYAFHIKADRPFTAHTSPNGILSASKEGLAAALEQLDEQITSIVVVDDNPTDSRLIRRLLQSYKQYRVFEAHDGQGGLELIRQRLPDLVVLDLSMPDTDGFAVLEALKADERTCEIPVVIISAKSLSTEEWEFLRRYANSIWQKGSFGARELASYVTRILGDEVAQTEAHPSSKSLQIEDGPLSRDCPVEDFGQDQRPCILVVDDYVTDARLMRRLFEAKHRFKVVEAHSATEALAVMRQTIPDLIILDLVLPDLNGEQLLAMLRERVETRDVPVVVVSAKDIDPGLRSHLAAQADSVWSKAVLDRSSLLAHVETILPE
jgi:threonine synthase